MASSEEGLKDLAAIAASYLKEHRPDTTVRDEAGGAAPEPQRAPVQPEFLERGHGGGGGGRSGGGGGGGGRRRRGGGRGGRR
jgi:hypothetical protein